MERVLETKKKIVAHLDPLFPELGLGMLDLSQIRFIEKLGEDKLTSVLHDLHPLGRYLAYDGQEIGIQILPEAPSFKTPGYSELQRLESENVADQMVA